jgi:hypothetical protein
VRARSSSNVTTTRLIISRLSSVTVNVPGPNMSSSSWAVWREPSGPSRVTSPSSQRATSSAVARVSSRMGFTSLDAITDLVGLPQFFGRSTAAYTKSAEFPRFFARPRNLPHTLATAG